MKGAFILDTEKQRKYVAKTGVFYLLATLFCVLFGAVYEYFSHGVYSGYMIYAFLIPLAGGAVPFCNMGLRKCRHLPLNLYNSGIATLAVGCILQGVLEIYGTTNCLIQIYWFVGLTFLLLGLSLYLIGFFLSKK